MTTSHSKDDLSSKSKKSWKSTKSNFKNIKIDQYSKQINPYKNIDTFSAKKWKQNKSRDSSLGKNDKHP